MIIETIVVGEIQTNCYILAEDKNSDCIIIDPGSDYENIKAILDKNKLIPRFIINTHGHIDHIGANGNFKIPIFIHRLDSNFLDNPEKSLSLFFGNSKTSPKSSRQLEDNDIVELRDLKVKVIHTPGHTLGSICLKIDSILFTGDTLFFEGIGRTDFPESDEKKLIKSIREKLFTLPDDIIIYPGHGPSSTIGYEKENNPFL
ncbi:MAG: MBL fold metallo-hydrolase [Candidatus Omnitrophica bacterium]|nr:MBL fold metallo-hydrolase [Candidatus Omnitrophota bacterium]